FGSGGAHNIGLAGSLLFGFGEERAAAEGGGWLATKMAAATYSDIARQYVRNVVDRVRETYLRLGARVPARLTSELNDLAQAYQRHGVAAQEAVKWIVRRLGKM